MISAVKVYLAIEGSMCGTVIEGGEHFGATTIRAGRSRLDARIFGPFLQKPICFSGRDQPSPADQDGMQLASIDQLVDGATAYTDSLTEVINAICQEHVAGTRNRRVNFAARGRWFQQRIAPVSSGHRHTKPDATFKKKS